MNYAKGFEFDDKDTSKFAEAVKASKQSDFVVMVMGKNKEMNSEASRRKNLD